MTSASKQALTGLLIGLVYWSAFSAIFATNEPWDGPYYWSAAYPGSMVIAVALGLVWRQRAWITGLSLTFAQLPIILVNTGLSPLVFFGVALLAFLSVPVILAAAMTSMRARLAATPR
jgi:hypothetical protein